MRIIGIRHRVKKTAEGEARPTQVAILKNGEMKVLELETETDELDFVLGRFPVSFRKPEDKEDVSSFLPHHLKWKKIKEEDSSNNLHSSQVRKVGKTVEAVSQIPVNYEGFRSGDKVAMVLGGSGDNLAFALARRGQNIGGSVFRIPPFTLNSLRNGSKKDDDAELLCKTLEKSPSIFYQVGSRDLSLIKLRESLRSRVDAMKARIACEQRLRQHTIGAIFCNPEGLFPEGDVEKQFDRIKANDKVYQALLTEEGKRERELEKACLGLDVYNDLFGPIKGAGPKIASRIIGAVIDIRRFETKAKFRAFCGVHVLGDGRFPRRRNNEVANWSGDCRQALYLLADQFNRRPDSEWGQKLLAAKTKYRKEHPETVEIDGKKRYTDGHIHKMAMWYTLGKFAEKLWKDWWDLENKTTKPKTNFPSQPSSEEDGIAA